MVWKYFQLFPKKTTVLFFFTIQFSFSNMLLLPFSNDRLFFFDYRSIRQFRRPKYTNRHKNILLYVWNVLEHDLRHIFVQRTRFKVGAMLKFKNLISNRTFWDFFAWSFCSIFIRNFQENFLLLNTCCWIFQINWSVYFGRWRFKRNHNFLYPFLITLEVSSTSAGCAVLQFHPNDLDKVMNQDENPIFNSRFLSTQKLEMATVDRELTALVLSFQV